MAPPISDTIRKNPDAVGAYVDVVFYGKPYENVRLVKGVPAGKAASRNVPEALPCVIVAIVP